MNFNVTYTRTTLDAQNSIPFITRDSKNARRMEQRGYSRRSRQPDVRHSVRPCARRGRLYGTSPSITIGHGDKEGPFYAQLDHQLTDSVKLIGGFQANKIENIGLNVVPRGGLIWTPTSRWSIKALYSQAFRAPSLNETLLQYVPPPSIGGPSLLGNPDLVPEKVATTDAGLSYQGNRFEAAIDYFHSVQTNNIVQSNVTTAGTYVNLGRTTFDGVEAEGKYYFRKNFFFTGSAAYQFNVDGSGAPDILLPFRLRRQSGISYASDRLTAGLFDVFQGPVSGYSGAFNPRPSAYSLLSANLRLDISKFVHAGSNSV